MLSSPVPPLRTCRVTLKNLDGVAHRVDVHYLRCSRPEPLPSPPSARRAGAEALTPNAVLHIEVQLPPITHDVPLKAIERWLRTPSVSPKEQSGEASPSADRSDVEVEFQRRVIAERPCSEPRNGAEVKGEGEQRGPWASPPSWT